MSTSKTVLRFMIMNANIMVKANDQQTIMYFIITNFNR